MGALSGPSGKLVTSLGIAFAGAGFLRETLNLERPRIFELVAVFLRLVLARPLGGSRRLVVPCLASRLSGEGGNCAGECLRFFLPGCA